MRSFKTLLACAAAMVATSVFAADPPASNPAMPQGAYQAPQTHQAMKPEMDRNAAHSLLSTKIVGINVENHQGEKIGTVEDLVINPESGKIGCAAIAVGGVLGIGEKLYAVPFDQLRFNHDKGTVVAVLNTTKEHLQGGPSFSRDQLPDASNGEWQNKVDTYYRQ